MNKSSKAKIKKAKRWDCRDQNSWKRKKYIWKNSKRMIGTVKAEKQVIKNVWFAKHVKLREKDEEKEK